VTFETFSSKTALVEHLMRNLKLKRITKLINFTRGFLEGIPQKNLKRWSKCTNVINIFLTILVPPKILYKKI
jgi:hypothetical protein